MAPCGGHEHGPGASFLSLTELAAACGSLEEQPKLWAGTANETLHPWATTSLCPATGNWASGTSDPQLTGSKRLCEEGMQVPSKDPPGCSSYTRHHTGSTLRPAPECSGRRSHWWGCSIYHWSLRQQRFWPQQCPVTDRSTGPGQAASQVRTSTPGVSAPAGEALGPAP